MPRSPHPRRHRSLLSLSTFVGAVVLAAACNRIGGAEPPPAPATMDALPAASGVPFMEGVAAGNRLGGAADAAKVGPPGVQGAFRTGPDSVAPNMVIRNGMVSIQVDSLEMAMEAVRRLATRLGGYVGNVSTSTGEYTVRSATLELKLPSSRFDEAMTTLTPIGKVEQSTSTAEDVGEEFVDMRARTANARRLEERLVTLLATRTGKLEDVLAVERELARVREEVERYEGRLRYLASRVSMSTLSVTVHEAAPLVSPTPGTSVLGEAVKAMWRNFVLLVAAVIASLGIVVPVGAGLALAAWAWRRRQRPADRSA